MDKIVNLCKSRGFVFPGSEIYNGFANTWDFGPVGVELKNNIKRAWWKRFVQEEPNSYGCGDFDESKSLGSQRSRAKFWRPENGLQEMQAAFPCGHFD